MHLRVLGLLSLYGVLESVYNKEITNEQAKQIATKAVAAAMERDPGSGNGIDVLVIPNLLVVKEEKKEVTH